MSVLRVTPAILAVAVLLPSQAQAGLSDFYATDADGKVFFVDGQTLQATQIYTLIEDGIGVNDILYQSNGTLLFNVTGGIVRYNLETQNESVAFVLADVSGKDGFSYMSGLEETSSGDVFFSVKNISVDGSVLFGATYNFDSSVYTRGNDLTNEVGLYYDFEEISENIFLAADHDRSEVDVFNISTGEVLETYSTPAGFVSFFENDGLLLAMSRDGDLYTFDADDGTSTFYGSIGGATGQMIGVTIPAPGVLSLLGLVTLSATRRRR